MKPNHVDCNELPNPIIIWEFWENEWTQNNPEAWSNDHVEAVGHFSDGKSWNLEVVPLGCEHGKYHREDRPIISPKCEVIEVVHQSVVGVLANHEPEKGWHEHCYPDPEQII